MVNNEKEVQNEVSS